MLFIHFVALALTAQAPIMERLEVAQASNGQRPRSSINPRAVRATSLRVRSTKPFPNTKPQLGRALDPTRFSAKTMRLGYAAVLDT